MIGLRAHDYGKQDVRELCRAIAADGWQTVQLAFPKAVEGINSFDEVTPAHTEEAMRALTDSKLTVAVLGVYIEPSLPDETERRKQAALFTGSLQCAKTLDAGCAGTETTRLTNQISQADALRQLRRSLEEILPVAEQLRVNVALEPVHYHTLNTPELTKELLREMRSEYLKVIFDPVNLLRPEDIHDQPALWSRCMDCFGEKIVAVHIKGASHNAHNGVLSETPLQSSIVDYEALFAHLRTLGVPFLREGAIPSDARADIDFISKYI